MYRLMLGLLIMGCSSNQYADGALALKWQLPPGVKLESEGTEGNITTARFSGGVEVRSVTAAPLPTEGDLDALRTALVAGSKMTVSGETRSGRSGTIPAGKTVRWEMGTEAERSLLYYVAGKDRYVLISLVAPSAVFSRRSDKLELSMSSLRLQ